MNSDQSPVTAASNNDAAEIIIVPAIGQAYKVDEPVPTIELRVSKKLTKDAMKPYLKAFGLGLSGNRESYLQRLRDYSGQPDEWKRLFQPVASRVRGAATGSRANRPSAKRIRERYGEGEVQTQYPSKKAATALPDRRTEQDIIDSDAWATEVLDINRSLAPNVHPIDKQPSNELHDREGDGDSRHPAQLEDGTSISAGPSAIAEPRHPTFVEQGVLIRRMERQIHNLGVDMSRSFAMLLQPVLSANSQAAHSTHPVPTRAAQNAAVQELSIARIQVSDQETGDAIQVGSHESSTPRESGVNNYADTASAAVRTSPTSNRAFTEPTCNTTAVRALQRTINLDNIEITFDVMEVPPIPTVSFAEDIPGLVREWYISSRVVVGGHGIPIRHWDKIYKKKARVKISAWASFRSTWNNWGFLVKEFESYPSESMFWAAYQNPNGQRLCYKQILAQVKAKRIQDNKDNFDVHASTARAFFKDDLEHPDAGRAFQYYKRGKWHVQKTDKKIGEAWLRLLEDNEEIRERWEEQNEESVRG